MTSSDDIRILLVDDDAGARFALHTILNDLHVAIETASSGEEALALLLKHDFAVIVLDVKMPGLDGFETAQLIRQRPRSKFTPIIFLTAHRATDIDRATGYALGAVDYLFMPVKPDVLKSKVQAFIDLARKTPQLDHKDVKLELLNQALKSELEHVTRLNEALRTEIAAREQAEGIAQRSEIERLIIQHAGDYVALLDANAGWVYASPSYQTEFGTAIRRGDIYFDLVHPDDREQVRAVFFKLLEQGANTRLQYRMSSPTRGELHLESEATLIGDAEDKISQVVMVSRDITERKEIEAYILHQSYHDALTGLPNRLLLEDRMKQATAHMRRQHVSVAILFIDLDRFKQINDTLGHAAGDRLLQEVAERLTQCVREGDTVARLAGDEFVVLLESLRDVRDAVVVADKIVHTVSEPCHIGGKELRVSPSIGVAIYPDDGQGMEELLRNADTAMYHAKQEGRGRYSFFTQDMNVAASQRLAVGAALQRAIQHNEFILHYQPRVSTASGEIRGFEALIRWPQENGDLMYPGQFIPIAEETGHIESIGTWVLQEAARQAQHWHASGANACAITVNLSARQFHQKGFAQNIEAVLHEIDIAPNMLEVELTESAVMSNPPEAIPLLQKIRDLGMPISVDHFGSGYSSLAHLKRLPLDKLKIDGAFIRDIASNSENAAIVAAIITLAHSLSLAVVAGGVETPEEMSFLIDHGCDEMQGNYFSHPVPAGEALELLKRGHFSLH